MKQLFHKHILFWNSLSKIVAEPPSFLQTRTRQDLHVDDDVTFNVERRYLTIGEER